MAWTFGVNVGDRQTYTGTASRGTSSSALFMAGWWCPTTLTATRRLWSFGNTLGAEIDSTTSELRIKTDNTTDKEWTTSGVGLALNVWKFLAFLGTFNNTGAAAEWRVWVGDEQTAPVEATVNVAVAGAGNFVGNASLVVGNSGAATFAWQGLIGSLMTAHGVAGVNNSSFPILTAGTITNEEANLMYQWAVVPVWKGDMIPPCFLQNTASLSSTLEVFSLGLEHAPQGGTGIMLIKRANEVSPFQAGTQSANASISATSTPRAMRQPANQFLSMRR